MNDTRAVSAWIDKPGKITVYMKNDDVYVFPTRHITFISSEEVVAGDLNKPLEPPKPTGKGRITLGVSGGGDFVLYFDSDDSAIDFQVAVTRRL